MAMQKFNDLVAGIDSSALADLIVATTLKIAVERIKNHFSAAVVRNSRVKYTSAHFELLEIERKLNGYISDILVDLQESSEGQA